MIDEYEEAVEMVAAHLCDHTVGQFQKRGESFQHSFKDKARSLLSLTWPSGQRLLAVLAKDQAVPMWHWLLERPVLYPEPIPCKGRLGFFVPDIQEAKK